MLFSANAKAGTAICSIAELLFREALTFGQFSIGNSTSRDRFERYVKERFAVTKFIFEVLEQVAELRFSTQASIPFIYNTNPELWPDNLPLAGYVNSVPDIKPSQVLMTLMMNWNLEITNKTSFSRLLTASLWIIDNSDLASALNYLLDVLETGYILYPYSLVQVIGVLLTIRSVTESDKEVVAKLCGLPSPVAQEQWKHIEYNAPTINFEINSISTQTSISILLNRTLQKIQRVRESQNYDDWLSGLKVVEGMATTFQGVMKMTRQEPSLGLKRILSQLEEIRADDPSMLFAVRSAAEPYENTFEMQMGLMLIFANIIGEGWEERFYQERLLVPAKLKNRLIYNAPEEISRDWQFASWKVVKAFTRAFLADDFSMMMRSKAFGADVSATHNLSEPTVNDHLKLCLEELKRAQLRAFELLEGKNYEELITHLTAFVELYPWSAAVYHEIAIAYDENHQHDLALEYICRAVVLETENNGLWQSLSVILRNLGRSEESRLASGLSAYFSEMKKGS